MRELLTKRYLLSSKLWTPSKKRSFNALAVYKEEAKSFLNLKRSYPAKTSTLITLLLTQFKMLITSC